MKKLLLASTIFCSTLIINAQSFKGRIEFKYSTQKDTTTNIYLVKDKLVKLDQYGKKSGNVEGSFIFDLNDNSIKFVNPKRRVWGIHKSETPPIIKGTCVVTKKPGSRKIQGTNCTEYVVTNAEENTAITYYVATEKYTFFLPVIKMWNRKDKQSIYFNEIKGLPEGSMPLFSEEKLISDNKTVTKLEVVKIGKTAPRQDSLEVPAGYNKFDQ